MQGTDRFKVASFLGCRDNKRFFKVQCKETLEFFTMEVVLKEIVENPNLPAMQFGAVAEPLPTWGLPFCMELKYVFETQHRRYYILDCDGEASLADMMNDGLPEPTVLFIAAEIALTLEGLHELGVSYNELDLTHLSVDSNGHMVLWREFEGKEYWHISECICGILGANCGKIGHEVKRRGPNLPPGHWVQISQGIQNDLNSLGILLCHLLTGNADFLNFQSLEEAIISLFITPNTKDFLYGLVSGSVQSFEDIKCHPCFRGLDWDEVRSKASPSPLMASYRPGVKTNFERRGLSKSPSLQNVYTAGISARQERGVFMNSPLSRTLSSSDIHSLSSGNARQSYSTTGRSGRRNTLSVPCRGGQHGREAVRLNTTDTKIVQDAKNLGYSQRVGMKSSFNLHRQVFEQNSRNLEHPPCMSAPCSPRDSFVTSQNLFGFPPPKSAPCSPRGSVSSMHSGSGSLSPSSTVVFNHPETNPFHDGYKKRWGSTTLDTTYGIYASNLERHDSNNDITTDRRWSDETTDSNPTKNNSAARGIYASNLKESDHASSSQSDGSSASSQPNIFGNCIYSSVSKQHDSFANSNRGPIVVLPSASTVHLTPQGYQSGHIIDDGSNNTGVYFNLAQPPSKTNISRPYFQPNYFEENRMQTHSIDLANPAPMDSRCLADSTGISSGGPIGFQRSGNLETFGTDSSFFQTSGNQSDSTEQINAKETANFLFQKHFGNRRGIVGSGVSDKVAPNFVNTENSQIGEMRQNPTSNASEEQFQMGESSYRAPAANSRNLSSNLGAFDAIQSMPLPNKYTASITQQAQSQLTRGYVQGHPSLGTEEEIRSNFNQSNQLQNSSDNFSPKHLQERQVALNTSQIYSSSLQTTAGNPSPPIVGFQQRNSCSPEPLIAIHHLAVPSSNPRPDTADVPAMVCDDTDERNPFQQISPRRRSSTDVAASTFLPISTNKFECMGRKTSLTRSTSCSDVRLRSAGDDPERTGQPSWRRSMALRRIPSFEEFRTMRAIALGERNNNVATKKDGNIVGKEDPSDHKNDLNNKGYFHTSDSARNTVKYNSSNKGNQNFAGTSSFGTANNPVIQDLLVKYGLDKSPRSSPLKLHQNSSKRPDSEDSHSPTTNNDDKKTKTQDATDTKQRLLNILDDFLAVRTKHKTLSSSASMYNLKPSDTFEYQRRPSLPTASFEEPNSEDATDDCVVHNDSIDMKIAKGSPGEVLNPNDSKVSAYGTKELASPRNQHRKVERCKNPTLVVSSPNSDSCFKTAKHQNTKNNSCSNIHDRSNRIEKKNYSENPKQVSKMKITANKYECEDTQLRVSEALSEQTVKNSAVDLRPIVTGVKQSDGRGISSEVEPKEGEESRRVSENARDVTLRHREALGLQVGKSGKKARNERRKSFKQALQNKKNEKTSEQVENDESSNVQQRVVINGPIKADHSVEVKPPCAEQKYLKHIRRMNRRTSSLLSLTDDLCDDLNEFEAENGIRGESLSDCNENYSGTDRAVDRDDGFLNVDSEFPKDLRASRTESSSSLLSRGSSFHSNFSADSGSVQLDFEESDEEDDLFYMSEPQDTDQKSESDIHRNDSGLGDEIGVGDRIKKRWQDLGHMSSRQSMVVASWRELASKNDKRLEDGRELANETDKQKLQQKSERKTSRGRRISREKQPNAIDCPDCGRAFVVENDKPSVNSRGPKQTVICYKCQNNRVERKEAIMELVQTEINYGNDFKIVKEEFLAPMQTGGIVSPDNLAKIFLNIQELLDVSSKFCMKIQKSVNECIDKGDEELCHMNVGGIFVKNVELLQAYELYCSRQPEAMRLLESLQKKNDVLRVFLNITCRENPKCRKMDINSFLLAPVQRVTKYPLLLSRIRRATPRWHDDREDLKLAQRKVEEQITKINSLTKSSEMKAKKFQSNLGSPETVDSFRLKKLASEVLTWTLDEMQLLMHGPLKVVCSEFGAGQSWTKRAIKRNIEIHMLFCIRGQNEPITVDSEDDDCLYFPSSTEVSDASLLLLKRKSNGKYILFRDEIKLRDCVVYEEMESDSFGIVHMGKESFLFTTKSAKDARKWIKYLKVQSKDQGKWRRRRNASANIMLKAS